jgi:hypothetical protein
MRDNGYMIAAKGFHIGENDFSVQIFHFPYARNNEYELYRNDELVADGKCPKEYTPDKIMLYHVRITPEELQEAAIEDEDEMEL